MRKLFVLLAMFAYINADTNQDYENIYLKGGANAVIKAIENNILNADFWKKKLEGKNVEYGYYDNDMLLTIVDKDDKHLEVMSYKNGKMDRIFQTNVLVGKSGDKLIEGDLKTPVGVYQLTRRFTPTDPYLGPLAFSLSYPNLYDKLSKRNGSGIWIHGFPLNGNREDEIKTKGCVAMENDILMQYDKIIDHQKSLALIYETEKYKANIDQISAIFAEIFSWKKSWTQNDIEAYLNFYDKDFKRYDGMTLENFSKSKKAIFAKKEHKTISFSNFIITPYPNSKKQNIFRVVFYEDYNAPSYKFSGEKTLYIKLDSNNKMKILIED